MNLLQRPQGELAHSASLLWHPTKSSAASVTTTLGLYLANLYSKPCEQPADQHLNCNLQRYLMVKFAFHVFNSRAHFHPYATMSNSGKTPPSLNVSVSFKSPYRPNVDLAAQLTAQAVLRACSGFSREFQTGQWTILAVGFPFLLVADARCTN